jgi:hypothetical protein
MTAATLRYWTDDEERRLLELKRAGKSVRLIAKLLNRTEVAIANRLDLMKRKGISYSDLSRSGTKDQFVT